MKKQLDKLKEKADEAGITKQGEAIKEKLSKAASQTAETVSKESEKIAKTKIYQQVSKVCALKCLKKSIT